MTKGLEGADAHLVEVVTYNTVVTFQRVLICGIVNGFSVVLDRNCIVHLTHTVHVGRLYNAVEEAFGDFSGSSFSVFDCRSKRIIVIIHIQLRHGSAGNQGYITVGIAFSFGGSESGN